MQGRENKVKAGPLPASKAVQRHGRVTRARHQGWRVLEARPREAMKNFGF